MFNQENSNNSDSMKNRVGNRKSLGISAKHNIARQKNFVQSGSDDGRSSRTWVSQHMQVQNTECFQNRKGLTIPNTLHLPENFIAGQAIDDGGCFFDSLAQILNQHNQTDIYSEKYLRVLCHEYYYANKAKVDHWNQDDYGGIDQGEDYAFVLYTKPELDEKLNGRAPIWGRPQIEGKILCRKLDLIRKIYVVELLNNPETKQIIPAYYQITTKDYTQISEDEYKEHVSNTPTLIVSQGALHFVPILPKSYQDTHADYPSESSQSNNSEKTANIDDTNTSNSSTEPQLARLEQKLQEVRALEIFNPEFLANEELHSLKRNKNTHKSTNCGLLFISSKSDGKLLDRLVTTKKAYIRYENKLVVATKESNKWRQSDISPRLNKAIIQAFDEEMNVGKMKSEDFKILSAQEHKKAVLIVENENLLIDFRDNRYIEPWNDWYTGRSADDKKTNLGMKNECKEKLHEKVPKIGGYIAHQKNFVPNMADTSSRSGTPLSHDTHEGLFQKRKGLVIPNITTILNLPVDYSIGQAVDDGGCFFDSLAQILNQIQQTDSFGEKYLRVLCHEYYYANKTEVDQWNQEDYGGIDQGEEYAFVQYTKDELDENFHDRTPIWGRPQIEGKILCQKLNLNKVYVVELLTDPDTNQVVPDYYQITAKDYTQISEDKYKEHVLSTPTLIVSQSALHFVPLLSKSQKNTLTQSNDNTKNPIAFRQVSVGDDIYTVALEYDEKTKPKPLAQLKITKTNLKSKITQVCSTYSLDDNTKWNELFYKDTLQCSYARNYNATDYLLILLKDKDDLNLYAFDLTTFNDPLNKVTTYWYVKAIAGAEMIGDKKRDFSPWSDTPNGCQECFCKSVQHNVISKKGNKYVWVFGGSGNGMCGYQINLEEIKNKSSQFSWLSASGLHGYIHNQTTGKYILEGYTSKHEGDPSHYKPSIYKTCKTFVLDKHGAEHCFIIARHEVDGIKICKINNDTYVADEIVKRLKADNLPDEGSHNDIRGGKEERYYSVFDAHTAISSFGQQKMIFILREASGLWVLQFDGEKITWSDGNESMPNTLLPSIPWSNADGWDSGNAHLSIKTKIVNYGNKDYLAVIGYKDNQLHVAIYDIHINKLILEKQYLLLVDCIPEQFKISVAQGSKLIIDAVSRQSGKHIMKEVDIATLLNQQPYTMLTEHLSRVCVLAALPDDRIASGSRNGVIRIWNSKTNKCIKTIKTNNDGFSALITLSNGYLASASHNEKNKGADVIEIWDTQTGQCIDTLKGHKAFIHTLLELPNGQLVSSGGTCSGQKDRDINNGNVRVWDTKSGELLKKLEINEVCSTLGVAYLGNNLLAACDVLSSTSGSIVVWDLTTKEEDRTRSRHGTCGYVTELAALPEKDTLLVGVWEGATKKWSLIKMNLEDSTKDVTLLTTNQYCSTFKQQSDGSILFKARDGQLSSYNPADNKITDFPISRTEQITDMLILNDETLVTCNDVDNIIYIEKVSGLKYLQLQTHLTDSQNQYYYLGIFLREQGLYSLAIESLQKSIAGKEPINGYDNTKYPEKNKARNAICTCYGHLGEVHKLDADYYERQEKGDLDCYALFSIALGYTYADAHDKALKCYAYAEEAAKADFAQPHIYQGEYAPLHSYRSECYIAMYKQLKNNSNKQYLAAAIKDTINAIRICLRYAANSDPAKIECVSYLNQAKKRLNQYKQEIPEHLHQFTLRIIKKTIDKVADEQDPLLLQSDEWREIKKWYEKTTAKEKGPNQNGSMDIDIIAMLKTDNATALQDMLDVKFISANSTLETAQEFIKKGQFSEEWLKENKHLSLLHYAAHTNVAKSIAILAVHGANITHQYPPAYKQQALMYTLRYGSVKAIAALMKAGANIEAQANYSPHLADPTYQGTALHAAVYQACMEEDEKLKQDELAINSLKALLSYGADTQAKNSKGETARDIASQYKREDIINLITTHEKQVKTLYDAIIKGDIKTVKKIVPSSVHPDFMFTANDKLGIDKTPIHTNYTLLQHAIHHNKQDIICYLLENKADVLARNAKGDIPLHWGADRLEICHLLLKDKIYEQLTSRHDHDNHNTPIQSARAYKKPEIADKLILLEAQAMLTNINIRDVAKTPRWKELLDIISKNNSINDIVFDNEEGNTLFHTAVMQSRWDCIEDLLLKIPTIDLVQKNKEGMTTILIAARQGDLQTLTIIHKSHPTAITLGLKSKDGFSMLHLAALNGHSHVVEFLETVRPILPGLDDYHDLLGCKALINYLKKKNATQPKVDLHETLAEALYHFVYTENLNLVKEVVKIDKAAINCLVWHNVEKKEKNPSLLAATRGWFGKFKGFYDIAKYLIEQGADVNLKNSSGHSVIHYAAGYGVAAKKNGDCNTLKLLLDNGVDINTLAADGKTALHWAIDSWKTHKQQPIEFLETIAFLMEHNIDLTIRDNKGKTAFDCLDPKNPNEKKLLAVFFRFAAYNENFSLLEWIYARYKNNHPEIFNMLEQKDEPRYASFTGLNALHRAALEGKLDLLVWLLNKPEIEVNYTTELFYEHRNTALMLALFSRNYYPNCLLTAELLLGKSAEKPTDENFFNNMIFYHIRPTVVERTKKQLNHDKEAIQRYFTKINAFVRGRLQLMLRHDIITIDTIQKHIKEIKKNQPEIWKELTRIDNKTGKVNLLYFLKTTCKVNELNECLAFMAKDDYHKHLNAFFNAAEKGNVQAMLECLKYGIDPNIQVALDGGKFAIASRASALHIAAKNGHVEVVELLLKWGADVNILMEKQHAETKEYCYRYYTPLHEIAGLNAETYASNKDKYLQIAKSLIKAGANLSIKTNDHISVLQGAAYAGHEALVKLFCESGANMEAGSYGRTALWNAAHAGRIKPLDYLISQGANINTQFATTAPNMNQGDSPLHRAVACRSIKCVKLLLQANADTTLTNCNKVTPIQLASQRKIEALCKAQASTDDKKKEEVHQAVKDYQAIIELIELHNTAVYKIRDSVMACHQSTVDNLASQLTSYNTRLQKEERLSNAIKAYEEQFDKHYYQIKLLDDMATQAHWNNKELKELRESFFKLLGKAVIRREKLDELQKEKAEKESLKSDYNERANSHAINKQEYEIAAAFNKIGDAMEKEIREIEKRIKKQEENLKVPKQALLLKLNLIRSRVMFFYNEKLNCYGLLQNENNAVITSYDSDNDKIQINELIVQFFGKNVTSGSQVDDVIDYQFNRLLKMQHILTAFINPYFIEVTDKSMENHQFSKEVSDAFSQNKTVYLLTCSKNAAWEIKRYTAASAEPSIIHLQELDVLLQGKTMDAIKQAYHVKLNNIIYDYETEILKVDQFQLYHSMQSALSKITQAQSQLKQLNAVKFPQVLKKWYHDHLSIQITDNNLLKQTDFKALANELLLIPDADNLSLYKLIELVLARGALTGQHEKDSLKKLLNEDYLEGQITYIENKISTQNSDIATLKAKKNEFKQQMKPLKKAKKNGCGDKAEFQAVKKMINLCKNQILELKERRTLYKNHKKELKQLLTNLDKLTKQLNKQTNFKHDLDKALIEPTLRFEVLDNALSSFNKELTKSHDCFNQNKHNVKKMQRYTKKAKKQMQAIRGKIINHQAEINHHVQRFKVLAQDFKLVNIQFDPEIYENYTEQFNMLTTLQGNADYLLTEQERISSLYTAQMQLLTLKQTATLKTGDKQTGKNKDSNHSDKKKETRPRAEHVAEASLRAIDKDCDVYKTHINKPHISTSGKHQTAMFKEGVVNEALNIQASANIYTLETYEQHLFFKFSQMRSKANSDEVLTEHTTQLEQDESHINLRGKK